MNLFIDTAATAHWQWDRAGDHVSQPHMIRLAAILEDDEGEPEEVMSVIIQPMPGWLPIHPDLTLYHHVDDQAAHDSPHQIGSVIGRFASMAARADVLVGHSVDFHRKLIGRAYHDLGLSAPSLTTSPLHAFCTMREATPIAQIPNRTRRGYKWPTLLEAAAHFAPDGQPRPPTDPEELGLFNVEQVRHIFHCIQLHTDACARRGAA